MTTSQRDELIRLLSSNRTFAGLKPEAFAPLLEMSDVHEYDADDVIWRRGDKPSCGLILINGRVEQREEPYPGRSLARHIFRPGSLLARGGFIKAWPHISDCVALEPTRVLGVDRTEFLRLIDTENPVVLRIIDELLDLYVHDLQGANQQLDAIFSRPDETLSLLREQIAEGKEGDDPEPSST